MIAAVSDRSCISPFFAPLPSDTFRTPSRIVGIILPQRVRGSRKRPERAAGRRLCPMAVLLPGPKSPSLRSFPLTEGTARGAVSRPRCTADAHAGARLPVFLESRKMGASPGGQAVGSEQERKEFETIIYEKVGHPAQKWGGSQSTPLWQLDEPLHAVHQQGVRRRDEARRQGRHRHRRWTGDR